MESGVDDTDWRLLEALQRDGRASYADLGRLVGLSASAVTERVRRLEESGVITGYAAEVDPEKVGLSIMALVRLRYPHGNYKPFHDLLATTPEVGEAHHVTGEDCFVLTVRLARCAIWRRSPAGSRGSGPSPRAWSIPARCLAGRC